MLRHLGIWGASDRTTVRLQRIALEWGLPIAAPVLIIGAYWTGGEPLLFLAALTLPFLVAQIVRTGTRWAGRRPALDTLTGLVLPDDLQAELSRIIHDVQADNRYTACIIIEIDDFNRIRERFGETAGEHVLRQTAARLRLAMRDADHIARIGKCRFAFVLNPVRQLDLEICVQMAARVQNAIEEPLKVDAMTIYVSCSVGFCQSSRVPEKTAKAMMAAAGTALAEAQRHGPSAIRAYSADMQRKASSRQKLTDEACQAFSKGQIRAWFQPQISTDTGRIVGFEALARWEHPDRGLILPSEFLETFENTGQLEHLGEVMLEQALEALALWDAHDLQVAQIGVNFSGDELRNPGLIDKIQWKLDQFGLDPGRLAVEVLETVVAGSPDDTISRNINGLARLGCQIDLDDFGTGHASISSIRRFAVSRLKIDRSFVMKSDQDPEQRRIVHAIVTMAERLGLQTLAEGVETTGEHTILAQLGCDHVQGYGIARPMPLADTTDWMKRHNAKLPNPPEIGRKTG